MAPEHMTRLLDIFKDTQGWHSFTHLGYTVQFFYENGELVKATINGIDFVRESK